jgi:hypothetical protein
MIYGKYWDNDQIIVGNVDDGDMIPHAVFKSAQGAPAFLVAVNDRGTKKTRKYLFVEIVPNTECQEYYLDLNTAQMVKATCAKVNVYLGPSMKFEEMTLELQESWPLAWFKLKTIPLTSFDPVRAYERAMGVIGK